MITYMTYNKRLIRTWLGLRRRRTWIWLERGWIKKEKNKNTSERGRTKKEKNTNMIERRTTKKENMNIIGKGMNQEGE